MKPPKFKYLAPRGLDEAIEMLDRHAGDGRLLAGGQSLLPMLNLRLLAPSVLIDLNHLSELDYIRTDQGALRIGSMTRQRMVEFSPIARRHSPLLCEGLRSVGHLPTRARGTLGGSLAHADPSAELPMLLLALEGEVVARGPEHRRIIKARDLFKSHFTTSLEANEMLCEIHIPGLPEGAGWAMEEIARRHGDFAVAAVTAVIWREGSDRMKARIAAAGVGPAPSRLLEVEKLLEDGKGSETAIEAAARRASEVVDPSSDASASAAFRKHLTGVLTERAVRKAIARAAQPS